MLSYIKEIIESHATQENKLERLEAIISDINIAKDIINGKYKYCSECGNCYLTKSFFFEAETKECKICTYSSPINSRDDEYVNGFVNITYLVCPKGHKLEIDRVEHTK